MLISDNQINPTAWEVSKIEDLSPRGITIVTLKQDVFNENIDNKELMIADYYKSNITPEDQDDIATHQHMTIKYSMAPTVKVGGSYKTFSVESEYGIDKDAITWTIEGLDDEDYSSIMQNDYCKIKISKNYDLIGKVFKLNLFYRQVLKDTVQIEVIGL